MLGEVGALRLAGEPRAVHLVAGVGLDGGVLLVALVVARRPRDVEAELAAVELEVLVEVLLEDPERALGAVHASRVAHRRDAVTHPELQHILGRRALRGAPRVAVHVDQAGKHVHSGKIEDFVTGIGLGPRTI